LIHLLDTGALSVLPWISRDAIGLAFETNSLIEIATSSITIKTNSTNASINDAFTELTVSEYAPFRVREITRRKDKAGEVIIFSLM